MDTAISPRPTVVNLGMSKDNTLYENPIGSISNGAGQHFFAGRTRRGLIRRGVIASDIVGIIPAGSTIDGVSLTLHMSRTGSFAEPEIELHKLLADWGEGTSDAPFEEGMGTAATPGDATWIHTFSDTATWRTKGGDFSATVSASQVVGAVGDYTWTSAEMAADVQGWLDNPSTNFGWLLLGKDEATRRTTKRFDTKENSTPTNRPVLAIDFTPPIAPDADGDGVPDALDDCPNTPQGEPVDENGCIRAPTPTPTPIAQSTSSPTATPPATPTPVPVVLPSAAQLPEGGSFPPPGGGGAVPPWLYILLGATAMIVAALVVRRWRPSLTSTRVIGARGGRDADWAWMRPGDEQRPFRRR